MQVRIASGSNVRYVNPARFDPNHPDKLYLRSLIVKNNAQLGLSVDGNEIKKIKKRHVQPSEMISISLTEKDLDPSIFRTDSVLEVSLQ